MAEQDARPPLRRVRDLLQTYVLDAVDLDEIRADMSDTAGFSTFAARSLRQDLEALEWALTADLPVGTLLHLVEDDANFGLDDDPTDAGAAVFLRQIADILREVLGPAR
uniref:hypothetical protein n=1 Tax=Paractinoplanes polyasparticus TaxID=2856853 RepID=UPI001C8571A3|nr:hypothetical protein [Actinoplanes polyasparticus]